MFRLTLAAAGVASCQAFVPQGSQSIKTQAGPEQYVVVERTAPSALRGASASSLAVAGLVVAGAAVSAKKMRKVASPVQRQVVGVVAPLTEKWDPLGLSDTDDKFEKFTAAEIKHGRCAMIATVGYICPEFFRFPGCETFDHGVGALSTIPAEGWAQIFALLGAHEVLIKPRAGGIHNQDYGFGTEIFDPLDDEEKERLQTSERNNGRLAMVAFIGMLWQDVQFGETPIRLLGKGGWWGTSVDMFIQDIPMCGGVGGCAVGRPQCGGRTAMRAQVMFDPFPEGAGTPEDAPFEPSPSVPYLQYPEQLKGWVGGETGFDPLGVTDALPVYYTREAELKHGRVAMLATVGWIATDLGVRFQGDQFQNVSTLEAHDVMVEKGYMGAGLFAILLIEMWGAYLCIKGRHGDIDREAGDFFVGKNFLPKDEKKAYDMKLKELNNGRLAMCAFGGIVTVAQATGKVWPFL